MLIFYALFVLPITALVSLAVYAPWGCRSHRLGKRGMWFHLPRYAFVGCLLSLVYLTILWYYPDITFHPDRYFWNLRPFIWLTEGYDMGMRRMLQQLVLNIGMFVPYGFLLSVVFPSLRKWGGAALAVLLTTLFIEITQFFMGRSADVDDVIMNLVGGLLGHGLFEWINHKCRGSGWWRKMLGA